MTTKRKIIILVAVLTVLAAASIAAWIVVNRMLDMETYRADLIRAVKVAINRDVRYGQSDFSLWFRPTFIFKDVVVSEKDGKADFVSADRLSFKIAILPLLSKKVILREIVLDNPSVAITRDVTGVFNISDLLDETKQAFSVKVKRLRIRNGAVHFTDRQGDPEAPTASLEQVNLRLDDFERGKTVRFILSASVADMKKRGRVAFDGTIKIAKETESLLQSRIDTAVLAKDLNVGRFWPYYRQYVPFKRILGRLDLDTHYRGNLTHFTSSGSITMHDLSFDYSPVFHAPLKPKRVYAAYEMTLDAHDIDLNNLNISVDDVTVKGSCRLKDIHTDDPLIDARAVTTWMKWQTYSHFIPYGVIPDDVADFIEQKIKGGLYRLDEGRLHGRISRIAHMERGDNANVLYIRGRAEQGVLEYASDVPAFTDLSGGLELKGRDFMLHDVTGRFGDAPFSLEGKLTDYCLDTPTSYPFTMNMTPTAKEVAWLFSDDPLNKFRYTGKSTLYLSGTGTTANFNLNGVWDLSAAHYQYPGWLDKPAGKSNHLNFKVHLNREEAFFSAIQYTLSPLSLAASARYRYAGKRELSLSLNAAPFQVRDFVQMIPAISKFRPEGMIQLTAKAESGPQRLTDLHWDGEIGLTDVSFKPPDHIRPISGANGKVRLRDNALETSQMTLRLGNSVISARGRVVNLADPSLAMTFTSPDLDIADLDLRHPKQSVHLKRVRGSVDFKKPDVKIRNLSFHLNDSILNVKGAVYNIQDQAKTDISLAATYLDWQDVMILNSLERVHKTGKPPAKRSLKAAIQVDAGRISKLAFRNLKTNLTLDGQMLYLEAMVLNALGGALTGNSRIDLTEVKAPRYQVHFKVDALSTEQCLEFFDIKDRLVTGAFSAQGNLTAKGGNILDLKKTALGNVRIQMEEGQLMRFAVLSKIFSILNISQLLKLQWPDMVRGGMPYNKITATLAVQDGMASTKDFYIQSDAMNISAVAAIDLIRKEYLHTLVGVQPLQTVDKAVSLIPVIGWVLTDKNRSVITVYFEVRGSMDDPVVAAIPVKAMARGILDIFKNIFQLPAKLFTDTGEVILGR